MNCLATPMLTRLAIMERAVLPQATSFRWGALQLAGRPSDKLLLPYLLARQNIWAKPRLSRKPSGLNAF